jgi:hypothetical protein
MLGSVIGGSAISSQPVARPTAPVQNGRRGRRPRTRGPPHDFTAELSSISWTTLAEAEKAARNRCKVGEVRWRRVR